MIVKNEAGELMEVLSDAPVQRKDMNISASREVQDHIIRVLTDYSYKHKVASIVREAVANSIDSNIEAGKKDAPVRVRLKRDRFLKWYFETEDQGLGLDQEGFDRYIMGIGESTKRDNPDTFGYFGGGAKAPLCKVDSFDWICRKDGVERRFTIFKTTTRPTRELIYERPTKEPNGVCVHIPLPAQDSYTDWKRAMREQLAYLPNIIYEVEGEDWNTYKILSAPDFEMREMELSQQLHVSLGGIYYPLDWDALDMASITLPVALKFRLDEGLAPIFSREALQYNEHSVALIKAKILRVAQWLQERYNEQVREFEHFLDALPAINNKEYYTTLGEKSILLNPILEYAGLQVNAPRVQGITSGRELFFKKLEDTFLEEYTTIGMINHRRVFSERQSFIPSIEVRRRGRIVLLTEFPLGYYKDFLKQHYPANTYFVKYKEPKRLWSKRDPAINYHKFTHKGYVDTLELNTKVPKELWRSYIQEWQLIRDEFVSRLEKGISKEDPRFLAYAEGRRQEVIERNRREGKTLDKVKGVQITVGRIRNSQTKLRKLTTDKEAISIDHLSRMKKMMVYVSEQELKEKNDFLFNLVDLTSGYLSFITLNITEMKHVQGFHQFKTLSQFMESRPFQRAVTAIAIQRTLKKIPRAEDYLYLAFPKYKLLKEKFYQYYQDNKQKVTDDFAADLFAIAEAEQRWDMNIYTELKQFEKILSDFSFLNYMYKPGEIQPEQVRVIKSMIYILARDRKLSGTLVTSYNLLSDEELSKLLDIESPQPLDPLEVDPSEEEYEEEEEEEEIEY